MEKFYSFIIPVYNRPEEIRELLNSMKAIQFSSDFEVVIVEDGSDLPCEKIVEEFQDRIQIKYLFKENTGPGYSRNYGMQRAKGNFFIILDSDVILPPSYLREVDDFLKQKNVDFFGGPDTAHSSFSVIQKAINYSMTSLWTTGGIRGNKRINTKYEPRSFNMGISKEAFDASGGFGNIHPGEDPDLSIRLQKLGFSSAFIPKAAVFHKRRIDFNLFYKQVLKFGKVRPILLKRYPDSFKKTYFFPSLFLCSLMLSLILTTLGFNWPIFLFILYFLLIFIHASITNKSIRIGIFAIPAVLIQFLGYGLGFMDSYTKIIILKNEPEKIYPNLFFKNV